MFGNVSRADHVTGARAMRDSPGTWRARAHGWPRDVIRRRHGHEPKAERARPSRAELAEPRLSRTAGGLIAVRAAGLHSRVSSGGEQANMAAARSHNNA